MLDSDLYWMAGLLEGEGSFLAPPPSTPNSPRITCSSTDEDVISRLAILFGQRYCTAGHARAFKRGWKPAWTVDLRGKKAVALMVILRPLMGVRRRGQIDRALSLYDAGKQQSRLKVTKDQAVIIRERIKRGVAAKVLASEFGVTLWTIYDIKNRTHGAKAAA